MHECPSCGQACTCNGDIEDHENELEAEFCVHDCEEPQDFEHEDHDDY